MFVFRCRRCHGEVTGAVREVPLPDVDRVPVPYEMKNGEECPPRMPPGTFAFDPPSEAAHRTRPTSEWEPVVFPSYAELEGIVLARADVRHLERTSQPGRLNGCCGLDGCDGPNLVCRWCRTEIATERSDCWTPQEVVLVPAAVEIVRSAEDHHDGFASRDS
ncbi:hypothetical protein ACFWZY_28735 [Streptomyces sp. NPDC058992]|uniref:hypothetical protein n=1 Tax=Streptomyces sp. NPDC058992 TaxID=3346688 RepID=UPI003693AC5E